MRSVFTIILKLTAILLAILAIFATIIVLFYLSFHRILLDPQTYKRAFAENHIYDQLPGITAQEFSLVKSYLIAPCAEPVIANSCLDSVVNTSQPSVNTTNKLGVEGTNLINGLNQDQWQRLVIHLLTPEEVQKSLDAAADELAAYFKGEKDSAGLPLLNVKTHLTGITSKELIALLLASQPQCTLEQQTFIMSGEVGKAGSPPIFCSATGGTGDMLVLDLQRRLNRLALEFPEQIVLIKPPSPWNPPSLQRILGNDLQATLRTLQVNVQYLPFLPVGLLVLAAIFAVRSRRGLLRWWGISIFAASFITLVVSLVLFSMFDQLWLNYISNHFPPLLTSGFGEIIYNIAHTLTNDVSQHLMLQAGIVMLLALGILFISNRVPAPPDPSVPPLAPPGTPGGPVLNPNRKKNNW